VPPTVLADPDHVALAAGEAGVDATAGPWGSLKSRERAATDLDERAASSQPKGYPSL
jgi:hypothetical protein